MFYIKTQVALTFIRPPLLQDRPPLSVYHRLRSRKGFAAGFFLRTGAGGGTVGAFFVFPSPLTRVDAFSLSERGVSSRDTVPSRLAGMFAEGAEASASVMSTSSLGFDEPTRGRAALSLPLSDAGRFLLLATRSWNRYVTPSMRVLSASDLTGGCGVVLSFGRSVPDTGD